MILNVIAGDKVRFRVVSKVKDSWLNNRNEVHYIGRAEILPPPLKPEEETKLLGYLGKEGDQKA